MKFDWNENTVKWYREANEYTGFFKNIAQVIKPKLKGYSSLCDIGCGIGLLDLELYNSIENITCIDISFDAIKALKEAIQEKKINNIKTQIMDFNDIQGQWDIICISFFGSKELERFLPYCKKLIAVVHGDNDEKLTPKKTKSFKKRTTAEVEERLRPQGMSYSVDKVAFEFGQPFRSIEEAKDFIKSHTPDISQQGIELFLSEKLIKTGKEQYPFFFPRIKTAGIFEINGALLNQNYSPHHR